MGGVVRTKITVGLQHRDHARATTIPKLLIAVSRVLPLIREVDLDLYLLPPLIFISLRPRLAFVVSAKLHH
jgi:hypothetical protein